MASEATKYKLLPLVKTFYGKTNLTSSEFVSIFKKYDGNNNGYINTTDIEGFLTDILSQVKDEYKSSYTLESVKKSFLENGASNGSAEISMTELSTALPTEDNFLTHFRDSNQLHISDFMKIWYHYDVDKNGYLECNELKKFLQDLLAPDKEGEGSTTVDQIDEYSEIILELFDKNNDGKIELSELSKILPVEENFLANFKTQELTKEDFDALFEHYDHDNNGYIEDTELVGFIRDLLENKGREPTSIDLEQYRTSIMGICDLNNDGKLSKSELELLLLGRKN